MRIGLISVMRDEGSHLQEWLTFHRAIGVTAFWVFDHNSRDETQDVLGWWAQHGVISTQVEWDGTRALQLQCLDKAHDWMATFDWVGLLDGDELMIPLSAWSLPNILSRVTRDFDGVAFNCLMFGERDTPGQSLLDITKCSGVEFARNRGFKSFVRGKALTGRHWESVHRPPIPNDKMCHDCLHALPPDDSRSNAVSYVHGRINHYKWRSEVELQQVMVRGEHGHRRFPRTMPPLDWWREHTNMGRDYRAQEIARYWSVSW